MKFRSVDDFLKYIYLKDSKTGNLAFRGQANFEWELKPSIHRGKLLRYQTLILETFLIYIFKDNNLDTSHIYTKQPIEFLAMCQHYGVPTRLLDISNDILVSLFFACNSNRDKDGALFIIDKNKFAKLSSKNFKDSTSEPLLVDSNFVNPRLRVQSGSFILWGIKALNKHIKSESYNLEEYLLFTNKEDALEKVLINKEIKAVLLTELDIKYGINNDSILLQNQFSKDIESNYKKMKEIADILTFEITLGPNFPSLFNINFAGCENLEKMPEEPPHDFSEVIEKLLYIVNK